MDRAIFWFLVVFLGFAVISGFGRLASGDPEWGMSLACGAAVLPLLMVFARRKRDVDHQDELIRTIKEQNVR